MPNARQASYGALHYYRAEGLKRGVADVFVGIGASGKHGLYIEFKRPGGRLDPDQIIFRDLVVSLNFAHALCFDEHSAYGLTEDYVGDRLTGMLSTAVIMI